MPQITGIVKEDTGSIITVFSGTANTTSQSFYFAEEQNGMAFRNQGTSVVTLTVNGVVHKVPDTIVIDDQNFTSFDVVTATGSQSFEIRAFVKKNEIRKIAKQTRKIKSITAFGNQLEFNSRTVQNAMKAENWEIDPAFSGTATDSANGVVFTKNNTDTGNHLRVSLDMPCNLQNKNIVVTLRADASVETLYFSWMCGSRDVSKFYQGISAGSGLSDAVSRDTVFSLNPLFLTSDGGTFDDLRDFRRLRLYIYLAAGQTTGSVTVKDIKIVDTIPAPGAVAIQFDDGLSGVYDYAYQKMKQYKMPGNIGVITGSVGTAGFCTLAQLTEMYNDGWDMVSHSTNETMLVDLTPTALKTALLDSQQFLASNGFLRSHRHLIYPGLQYNDTVLKEVKKYYLSARASTKVKTGYPICERYHYGQVVYISNTTTLQSVKDQIDRTKQFGGICMITLHNIVADEVTPTTYQNTVSFFTQIVDYIASSGVGVVRISDLFEGTIPDQFLN